MNQCAKNGRFLAGCILLINKIEVTLRTCTKTDGVRFSSVFPAYRLFVIANCRHDRPVVRKLMSHHIAHDNISIITAFNTPDITESVVHTSGQRFVSPITIISC